MTKSLLILAIFVGFLMACSPKINLPTSTIINQECFDRNGLPMLIGLCSKSSLMREPYRIWYEPNYNAYTPDSLILKKVKPNIENDTYTIFMATWCGDSQNQVPKFLKILRQLNIPQTNYKIVMVDNASDRYKQSPSHEEVGQNIFRVPTFVVSRNGKEIGRIIENPVESLEKDLSKITNDEPYFPYFQLQSKVHEIIENQKIEQTDIALKQFAQEHKSLVKSMSELNSYGYVLLGQKRYNEAIKVLKINTFLFPENDNAYDSLGEAYMIAGKKDLAVINYEKALKINPKAEGSKKMLEKLKG
jgi:tetratricopeptide (TPR) repeat protein